MRTRSVFGLLIALFALALCCVTSVRAAGTSLTVSVPGSADVYLAGMPAGSSDLGGQASAPKQSPVEVSAKTGFALTPGQDLAFDVTGSGDGNFPPDGEVGTDLPHFGNGTKDDPCNGMSSITGPRFALIGVFLDANEPDQDGAVPPELKFPTANKGTGNNFTSLAPQLRQPFYIGDGRTNDGKVQSFTVPAGATRLFLGDWAVFTYLYWPGHFSVTVHQAPLANPPILTIDKQASVPSVKPGDTYHYTLTYQSDPKGSKVTDPVVIDPLPEGTAFVSAFFLDSQGQETSSPVAGPNGHNPEFSGGNVIWYLGKNGQRILDAGDTGKLKLNVQVPQDVSLSKTVISNRDYQIKGTAGDGSAAHGAGPTRDVTLASVQLTVTPNPTTVAPGGLLTYTLTVTNNTASTILRTEVQDPVPAGTTFGSAPKGDLSAGRVTWSVGDTVKSKTGPIHGVIQPGDSKSVTLMVQVPWDPDLTNPNVDNAGAVVQFDTPAKSGQTVAAGDVFTPISGDARNAPQLGAVVRTEAPDDAVEELNRTIQAGQILTYHIDYFNTGGSVATNAVLSEHVATGMGNPSNISGTGKWNAATRQITWRLGDLMPGAPTAPHSNGSVSYTIKVPKGTADDTIIRDGPVLIDCDNLEKVTHGTPSPSDVVVVPAARLNIQVQPKVSFLTAQPGKPQQIIYDVSYINLGGGVVKNATVTAGLPANTDLDTSFAGPHPTVLPNGNLQWNTGKFPPRKWQTFQFALITGATSGAITEGASIRVPNTDVSAFSDLSVVLVYSGAKPFVGKFAPLSIDTGKTPEIVYHIEYGNTGDLPADNPRIIQPLPAGTTFVSASDGGVLQGNQVVWSPAVVPNNYLAEVTLTVQPVSGTRYVVCPDAQIITTSNPIPVAPYGPRADETVTRYSGTLTTVVREKNALFQWCESVGAFFQGIGASIANAMGLGNFNKSLASHPVAKAELESLGPASVGMTFGGLGILGVKKGAVGLLLGGGQAGLIGAASVVSNDGGSVISNDGGSLVMRGDVSQLILKNPGAGYTSVTVEQLLKDRDSNGVPKLISQDGGSLVAAGAGNLITQDGGSLVSPDGGSLGPIQANIAALQQVGPKVAYAPGGGTVSGVIGENGHGLITQDGGSLITQDGGSLIQINGGYVISTSSGRVITDNGSGAPH